MNSQQTVRTAEHPSIGVFLKEKLDQFGPQHVAVLSFDQWPWSLTTVAEIASASHRAGYLTTVGLWADHTPLRGVGWSTSRRIARFLRSTPIEDSAQFLIESIGLPETSFAAPPLLDFRPRPPKIHSPTTRKEIRKLTYRTAPLGRSLLQVHPNRKIPVREDFVWPKPWVTKAAESFVWTYEQTRRLIEERGITTLVVFNGRFLHESAAAAAAQSLGVRTLFFDYGGIETSFDLTSDATHDSERFQERMLTMWDNWGPEREQIARRWFESRAIHTAPGIDAFVGHQQRDTLVELPSDELIVVFFSSSPDEFAELDLDWSKHFGSQEDALLTLADLCESMPKTRLVVRTHPHMLSKPTDDLDRWTQTVNVIGRNIHIPPNSPTDSYALMKRADRVVTYGSTTGVEAAYAGRPVAVLGPCAYDFLDCATVVRTKGELRRWLIHPQPLNSGKALPYGLMMERRGFNREIPPITDGANERLVDSRVRESSPLSRKVSDLHNRVQLRSLGIS